MSASYVAVGHDLAVRTLHAVVGHKLPVYFRNAVASVRALAPDDDILIVDNASGLPSLTAEFERLGELDEHVQLLTRGSNELGHNAKVGGLYDAYREVLVHALAGGYELLHLVQADMQMLWWGPDAIDIAADLFTRFPECVNVHTTALPRDRAQGDTISWRDRDVRELNGYGLSDTGLFHLGRFAQHDLRFEQSEQAHARAAYARGLRVLCHPVPPVAQIPWPAVVRDGRTRGREVQPRHALLLRPLDDGVAARARARRDALWLEDVCVPWGWTCWAPMYPTAPESIDYWIHRYRDLRAGDLARAIPRYTRQGLDAGGSRWRAQRRPRLIDVVMAPAQSALRRRYRAR